MTTQMGPETHYYQIGGYRAHSNAWDRFRFDHESLARAIAGKDSPLRPRVPESSVELVLGIMSSGASYVLMTEDQVRTFTRELRLQYPRGFWSSTDFLSLSPIRFRTFEELSQKLKTYNQKSKRHKGGDDNSQANRGYISNQANPAGLVAPGVGRSTFEHCRQVLIFYAILKREIDCFKFGIAYPPWSNSVRIVSLAINLWGGDKRKPQEILSSPCVLDVGWTEISGSEMMLNQNSGTTVHYRLKENTLLGTPGLKRQDYDYGTSEIIDRSSLAEALRGFFKNLEASKHIPVILLVHNQSVAESVLRSADVDLSRWQNGIRKLIYSEGLEQVRRSNRSRSRSPARKDSQRDPGRRQSPPRIFDTSRSAATREESSRRTGTYAPIYLIDVQAMYHILTGIVATQKKSIVTTARELLLPCDTTGWCAGNECHTLIDIWRSFVQGPPIDEQKTLRQVAKQANSAQTTSGASLEALPAPEESDEDRDPNDMVYIPIPGNAIGMSGNPYDDMEDDEVEDW